MEQLNKLMEMFNKYISNHNLKLTYASDGEFYFSPKEEEIHLGTLEESFALEDCYKAYHECSHSTMNETKRDSSNYALEEVTADFAASQILSKLSVYEISKCSDEKAKEHYELMIQNIAYTSSWLSRYLTDSGRNAEQTFELIEDEIKKILKLVIGGNN